MRELRDVLESRLKVKLGAKRPVLPWLVEHAALVINRFEVGEDGDGIRGTQREASEDRGPGVRRGGAVEDEAGRGRSRAYGATGYAWASRAASGR